MAAFVELQDSIVNVDEIKFVTKIDTSTYGHAGSHYAHFTIYYMKDVYQSFTFYPRDYGAENISDEGFLTKVKNIRNRIVQKHYSLYKIDEGINLKKKDVSSDQSQQ